MRPPSSGGTGTRLNKFSRIPVCPSATRSRCSSSSPAPSTAHAAREPTTGPAIATRAQQPPPPRDRVGAARDAPRPRLFNLEAPREGAGGLARAGGEEGAGPGGPRRNFLGLPRARRHRRLWLLQALVHGAQVLDLPRAALGVARRGHAGSFTGRGMIQASYTTIARNTSFITPKFAASTW